MGKEKLSSIRSNILLDANVSFEYIRPKHTNDGHCRWVCQNCSPSPYYKSFPSFNRHLSKKHGKDINSIVSARIAEDKERAQTRRRNKHDAKMKSEKFWRELDESRERRAMDLKDFDPKLYKEIYGDQYENKRGK